MQCMCIYHTKTEPTYFLTHLCINLLRPTKQLTYLLLTYLFTHSLTRILNFLLQFSRSFCFVFVYCHT